MKRRTFPEDTQVIDFCQPLRKLPRWARIPVALALLFGGAHSVLRKPEPGEPQLAIWITLLLFVAAFVLQELLRPKPDIEDARPAGLGDFKFPTATEDRVVPLVWGRVKLEGPNVVWYGDLYQQALTEKVKTGLWSSERITTGFKYHLGVQFGLSRGPGIVLRRVWIGDTEVLVTNLSTDGATANIDKPFLFGGTELGNGGVQGTIEFYTGTTTQPVSTYLGLHQDAGAGTDRTPRYTGTCHIVARGLNTIGRGCYLGNSTAIKTWAFEVERYPGIFSGQDAGEHKISTTECNAVNVLYEILTDVEWGYGFPVGDIDVGPGSSFLAAADTMITEANGFSFILDRKMESADLIKEIERQIDGVVFLDHKTGKWKIKLARDDYNIDTVPQLTDSNVSKVSNFTRGGWEDTTNQITVKFTKREEDDEGAIHYKESFALAQDMGNALIQGGGTMATANVVSGQVSYPGVKLAALAVNLAWRDLRGQSYPLARATFTLNREFWDLTIGDVVAWTSSTYQFTKLPMRITAIDYGRLQDNKVKVTAVQDVFRFAAASFAAPSDTLWSPPVVSLVAFPAAQILVEEAARALVVRDPAYKNDPNVSKLFCAARLQGAETAFDVKERNASGTPAGTYALAGTILAFQKIGELNAALAAGVVSPTATITVVPTPDSQADIEEAFVDTTSLQDMGVDLVQLIKVGNEYMLVQKAADNGGNVDLQNVYRGALDSAQEPHAAAADVFLIHLGAGVSDTNFVTTHNVDVELRMKSAAEVFDGAVTPVALAMAKRPQRPYPPAAPKYNTPAGSQFGTPAVEDDGAGENGFGFDVNHDRRDYRTTDEVAALLADDSGVDSSTEYRVTVFVDPDGSNDQVFQSSWATGTGPNFVNRLLLWEKAPAGTKIRVQIEARHDSPLDAVVLVSRYDMIHDVVPTSDHDGEFYLGGEKRANEETNAYTALATGTYRVNIGAAYSTSIVQYELNDSGSWLTAVAATATTGTFAVTTNDVIRLRHTVNESPSDNFIELENPSAAVVAYGTLSD